MIQYSLIITFLIFFIIKHRFNIFALNTSQKTVSGGARKYFHVKNENSTKFYTSTNFKKTVYPTDALIARPGAWSIESTNILLAKDESLFVESRSEDCSTFFSRLTLFCLKRSKVRGQYGH